MAASSELVAAIDGPTAGLIIAAVISAAAMIAVRMGPKTRSEAGLDRANANLVEAQGLALLAKEQREELTRVHARVDELENALAEERRECDRRIAELGEQIAGLNARINDR